MKFKINTACDLNSISVLPPSSRLSSGVTSRNDALGVRNRQVGSQHWSQSQQSSQGMPMSQLSQSSLEENHIFDKKFESQDNNPSKRISSLVPMGCTREDSQMQLSRTSNNDMRRWKSMPDLDNRGHFSEEIEHRFRQVESSLSRLCLILDSVQSDVIQVNKAVKELTLEMESIRQKIVPFDCNMQQVLKMEENIKSFLDGRLRTIHSLMIKESNTTKLNEILSTLTSLPEKIETPLLMIQRQVCRDFLEESKAYLTTQRSQERQEQEQNMKNGALLPPKSCVKGDKIFKSETAHLQPLKSKVTGAKVAASFKQEAHSPALKDQNFMINIDSNEESDGDSSCIMLKNVAGSRCYSMDEAREESLRILRRARKRKRKQSLGVVLL